MNLNSDDIEEDGELASRKRNDFVSFKVHSDVLCKTSQNRGLKVTTDHAYSSQNEIYDSGIHSDFIPSQASDEVPSAETLKSLKSLTLSDEPKLEPLPLDDGLGSLRSSKSPDTHRDPEADRAESESIQQYLAFVEDTFNQDEDGDT